MKKFLVPASVIALALLIAVPSFALEVKWGGLFRARVLSQSNFTGSTAAGTSDYGYPPTGDLSNGAVSLGAPQNTVANTSLGIPRGVIIPPTTTASISA